MGESRFFQLWHGFTELVGLSVVFCLCCLPVLTLGDACAALYYAVVKSVRRGRGGPYREFFRAFRENLRQSLGPTVLQLLLLACFFFSALYVVNRPESAAVDIFYTLTMILSGLFALLFFTLACPIVSRFRFSLGQTVRFTLRLFLRHLPSALGLILLWLLFAAACWFFLPALLFAPGLYTLLASFLIEPVFRAYMPDRASFPEGEDTWYLE